MPQRDAGHEDSDRIPSWETMRALVSRPRNPRPTDQGGDGVEKRSGRTTGRAWPEKAAGCGRREAGNREEEGRGGRNARAGSGKSSAGWRREKQHADRESEAW